jgi:hypothetical protein
VSANDYYFIVVCRADVKPDGTRGDFSLATRTLFRTHDDAQDYMARISDSREPFIVNGRFLDLRIDDGRFE